MAYSTLVGRFYYRKLVKVPLAHWVDETWKPLLGYSLEIFLSHTGMVWLLVSHTGGFFSYSGFHLAGGWR
jgi:hypothetical protein